jgi:hypothetical protein
VLDLAAGPGLLARDAARQVLPGGWVLASDIAEGMLAEGQPRAPPKACPTSSPPPATPSTWPLATAASTWR